jgi:hypothetical protein
MDISIIEESLVTVNFEVLRDGEVVDVLSITFDRNKFTGEYDRRQGKLYGKRVRELEASLRIRYGVPSAVRGQNARRTGKRKGQAKPAPGLKSKEAPDTKFGLDKVADDFMQKSEMEATLQDLGREVLADSLAVDRHGVIKAWSMTRQEVAVEPTFVNLVRLPTPFLSELQVFLRSAPLPKEARTLRVRTMSDSTEDTSPSEPDTPTAASPIM